MVVLAASILLVAMAVEIALGGLNGSSAAIVFGYLAPVLALLGLGPRVRSFGRFGLRERPPRLPRVDGEGA